MRSVRQAIISMLADRGIALTSQQHLSRLERAVADRVAQAHRQNTPNDHMKRRAALIQNHGISLVLDIGANKGQYAESLREEIGFQGRIVSFEPLADAYAVLQQKANGDSLWTCHNIALGDSDGVTKINISRNSYSSSLLPVSERSLRIEPTIAYIGEQEIAVRRLDSVLNEIAQPNDKIYLKVDAQGYEMKVLKGALGSIGRFEMIQLETSFFPAYENEALIGDVIKFLDVLEYCVVGIEPGWQDSKTGEMFQADIIFRHK